MSIQTFQKSEVQIESRKKELAKRESDRVVRHFKHLQVLRRFLVVVWWMCIHLDCLH